MNDIEAVLARIAARRPRIVDLSLDRVFAALSRLGDPHKRLPPAFHVAGTNGKGSTVAYLKAALEAAGKSVHVYTSPHLVRFNERVVVAGNEISDAALIGALERCDEAVGDQKLTYFETATCAAFLVFAETPADYLVLEVGLGGRLDATNVLDRPLAAVVTAVDMDHEQFLGDQLALVAAEKAGIFRKDAPAVIGPQSPDAMAALMARAEEIGAPAFAFGRQWTAYSEHGRLTYQDENGLSDLAAPRLFGAHQIENAGIAVAALKAAGVDIGDEAISAGLSSACWPARMQRLTTGPLIDAARQALGEEPEIWLDGGHNPSAGRVVAAAVADLEARSPKRLVMISGMQANKNAEGYFAPFADIAAKVYAVAADHEGAAAPEAVAAAAEKAGLKAQACPSVDDALRVACAESEEPPRILVSGSLYLAGEILRKNS